MSILHKKLLLSLSVILSVQLAFFKTSQTLSAQYLDAAFKRSLSVFAIARAMNGLISVVQGTEIYATPAGVGVNFAVGQALDPINDMVERFSWVMLMSSVSLGIQELVLELTQVGGLKILLAICGLGLLMMIWLSKLWQPYWFNVLFKLFILLALVRFFVPMTLVVNELVYTQVLEPKYIEAKSALELNYQQSQSMVNQINTGPNASNQSWLDSLNVKEQIKQLRMKVERMWHEVKAKFEKAIDYMMVLISIFIIQSVIFPLAFLWIAIYTYKRVVALSISDLIETK